MHDLNGISIIAKDNGKRICGGLFFKHHHTGWEDSDLGTFSLNPVQNCFVRGITESTINSVFLMFLISFAQPLRAEVEGVSERFVDAG